MTGWALPWWVTTGCRLLGFAIVGLLLVFGVWVNRQDKRRLNRTAGLVCGLVGRQGSGKSYAAVRMALDRLSRGVDVYSNFSIDMEGLGYTGKWHKFTGWDQLAFVRNAVVIVDEAHQLAPSHQHVNFPMAARATLSQGRKHGVDLYWISQHEDRVNRTLRDLTNVVGVCESFFEGAYFVVTYYEPEKVRKPKAHIYKRRYRMDLKVAERYDTLETIEADHHALKGDDTADLLRRAHRFHRNAEASRNVDTAPAAQEPPRMPALPPR